MEDPSQKHEQQQQQLATSTLVVREEPTSAADAPSAPSESSSFSYFNFSKTWTDWINQLRYPLIRALVAVTDCVVANPKSTCVLSVVVALVLFVTGLNTNFVVNVDVDQVWTPAGSRPALHRQWIESADNNGQSLFPVQERTIVLVFHDEGRNVLSHDAITQVFFAMDAIRNLPDYEAVCAEADTLDGPNGTPYCELRGVMRFWNDSTETFEAKVSSDQETIETLSADTFPDGLPVPELLLFGYPVRSTDTNLLTSVESYTVSLHLPDTDASYEMEADLLETILGLDERWQHENNNAKAAAGEPRKMRIAINGPRSFPDEALRAIESDLPLIPAVFLIMSAFTCLVFSNYQDAVQSRSLLGLTAVVGVLFSLLSSYGVLFIAGVPLTSLTQVLPFIIFGVGLDDAFIIFGEFRRTNPADPIDVRIRKTMTEIGLSIIMTTLTSSVAFGLGGLSSIPAAKYLALYGFPALLLNFWYQVTFFVACIVLDERRIQRGKRDCCFCLTARGHGMKKEVDTEEEGESSDESSKNSHNNKQGSSRDDDDNSNTEHDLALRVSLPTYDDDDNDVTKEDKNKNDDENQQPVTPPELSPKSSVSSSPVAQQAAEVSPKQSPSPPISQLEHQIQQQQEAYKSKEQTPTIARLSPREQEESPQSPAHNNESEENNEAPVSTTKPREELEITFHNRGGKAQKMELWGDNNNRGSSSPMVSLSATSSEAAAPVEESQWTDWLGLSPRKKLPPRIDTTQNGSLSSGPWSASAALDHNATFSFSSTGWFGSSPSKQKEKPDPDARIEALRSDGGSLDAIQSGDSSTNMAAPRSSAVNLFLDPRNYDQEVMDSHPKDPPGDEACCGVLLVTPTQDDESAMDPWIERLRSGGSPLSDDSSAPGLGTQAPPALQPHIPVEPKADEKDPTTENRIILPSVLQILTMSTIDEANLSATETWASSRKEPNAGASAVSVDNPAVSVDMADTSSQANDDAVDAVDAVVPTRHESHASERIMAGYAKQLLRPWVKAIVVIFFTVFFLFCSNSAGKLVQEFKVTDLVPDDSYMVDYTDTIADYTSGQSVSMGVYFRFVNQSDESIQIQMENYMADLVTIPSIDLPPEFCWLKHLHEFVDAFEQLQKLSFYEQLDIFLQQPQIYRVYNRDIARDANGTITATRCHIGLSNFDINDVDDQVAALFDQRAVTKAQPINQGKDDWPFFSYVEFFDAWEFYSVITDELGLVTFLGVASVTFIALVFIPHWSAALFVLPMISILYINLLGVMQWAGIAINATSFVALSMSIGLLVDFIMHVLLSYNEAEGDREQKSAKMLSTMGASILLGGASTFLGTMPLAFSSSEVMRTIFVVFVALVVLGLSHGLIFFPVVLSVIGPEERIDTPLSIYARADSQRPSATNQMDQEA